MRRLGLAAVCLLSACGGPPEPGPTSRPLRVVLAAGIKTLDPQVPFDDVHSAVLVNLFDTLVAFDRQLQLVAGLAQRWLNPDDRTWRFFLDPQARFPDGSTLKASDVKFSLDRVKTLRDSQLQGFVRHVTSVEVVDDQTVDLHTDAPVAILNSLAFVPILSERHVKAAGDRVSEQPFGTGPYRLERWERGRAIVLEANPHHLPQPAFRRVEILLREDRFTLDQLLGLKPDLGLFVPFSTVEELERGGPQDLRLVSSGGLAVYYLVFNVRPRIAGAKTPNPLADVRVRQALALALDQEELIRVVRHGYGRPASQLVVPQVFGFDPSMPPLRHDPERARKLLAEAGQAALEVPVLSWRGGTQRLEKALVEQWRRAGVRARLEEVATTDEQTRAIEEGRFSATVQGYICTSADASELLGLVLHTREAGRGYGDLNYAGWSSPELDRLTEENPRLLDPKARLVMLQRALRIASEALPYLPLFSSDDVYAVSRAIEFAPRVNGDVRLSEVTPARPSPRP